jgi:phosphoribosylaminoimidazole-succinocarboxamide synthase
VRDVYEFGDRLLIVATDRISAFDWILPSGIPDKGRVLTQLSAFWFGLLQEPNHLISTELNDLPALPADADRAMLNGRSMVVRKTKVIPIECVVRGYLSGSGWKDYSRSGCISGVRLPSGLRESDRLPGPIFTPTTKEQSGHDQSISMDQVIERLGPSLAQEIKRRSIGLYSRGADYARTRGLIIADTKFEWGLVGDELIVIDEVLTPDSSRFWPLEKYVPGGPQPSFDKQFVRDWLEASSWDKNSPAPVLPTEVVAKTREKYIEAFEVLTGQQFSWR